MSEQDTRTAEVRLTADVDPYREEIKKAGEDTTKLAKSVDKVTTSLSKMYKEAGKKLTIAGGATLAGIAGVTKQAADYEKRLGTLQASAAVTTKSMAGFHKEINGLAKDFPIARGQAVELIGTLDKMGVSSTRRMGEIAESALRLSEATGEGVGGLTTGIVELSRQMGTLHTGNMDSFANSLLLVSKNAGVSATGVLSFASAIAPAARTAEMSSQEILGVSAAFTKAGADGFAGASAFNQILTDIQRQIVTGSPEIAKYANLIGVTSEQFSGMDRAEALTQIFETINAQGPDAIKTLDRLGFDGVRTMRSIQAVSQGGGLRQAIAEATGLQDSNALRTASEAAMGGLSDELDKTGAAFERFTTTVGTPFLAVFTPIVETFNGLLSVVNALAAPLAAVGASLAGVLGGGALALGAGVLMARLRNMVNTAQYIGRSSPSQALRGGWAAGRAAAAGGPTPVNAATTAAAQGRMAWWNRPFYTAGQAVGAMRERGTQGARGVRAGSMVGSAVTSPLRFARWFTEMNRQFVVDARTSGFDRRTPILSAMGRGGQSLRDNWRHPVSGARTWWAGREDRRDLRAAQAAAPGAVPGTQGPRTVWGGVRQGWGQAGELRRIGQDTYAAAIKAGETEAAARLRAAQSVNAHAAALNKAAAGASTNASLFRQLSVQTGRLSAAFLRFQLSASGSAIAGAAGAGMGALRWAGNALGGPMMGVMAAMGGGMYINSKVQEQNEALNEDIVTSSLDKYNAALGKSTTELGIFATALADARANLPKAKTPEETAQITPEVEELANQPGREVVNEELRSFKTDEGVLAWLRNQTDITDPEVMQEIQADLVHLRGRESAQNIISGYFAGGPGPNQRRPGEGPSYNEAPDYNALAEEALAKTADSFGSRTLARLTGTLTDESATMLKQTYVDITSRRAANEQEFGAEYANQAQYNDVMKYLAGFTNKNAMDTTYVGQSKAWNTLFDKAFDEVRDRYFGADKNIDADEARKWFSQQGLGEQLTGGTEAQQAALWDRFWQEHGGEARVTPDRMAGAGEMAGMRETGVSDADKRMIEVAGQLGEAVLNDEVIQNAVDLTGDINAQYKAAIQMLDMAREAAGGLGASFADVDAELQKIKVGAGWSGDQLAQIAASAQAMNAVKEQASAPFMSSQQRLESATEHYQNVMAGDHDADDFQERRMAAEQRLLGEQGQRADWIKGFIQTHKNFAIQSERVEADRTRGLEIQERDFRKSMMQGEEDYLRARARRQEDFTRQLQRQGKEQAKAIYDPMRRTYAEYTTDASVLLSNLTDQNRRIQNQMANLERAQGMGLSMEAIETLRLADPDQAQNLQRIVDDLGRSPELVGQINAQAAIRVQATTELVQSPWSETFTNAKEDFDRQGQEMEEDYQRTVARANESYETALADQAAAHKIAIDRSLEDLARYGEEIFGSFDELMAKALELSQANLGAKIGDTKERITSMFDEILKAGISLAAGQAETGQPKARPTFEGEATSDADWSQIAKAWEGSGYGTGKTYTQNGVTMLAAGGVATRATKTIVGEFGPEAVVPLGPRAATTFFAPMIGDIAREIERNQRHDVVWQEREAPGARGQDTQRDFSTAMAREQAAITRAMVRDLQTVATPTQFTGGSTTVDASTNFTGPVTVQAQDPDKMARDLKEKARIKKLTRPTLTPQ